MPDPIIPIPKAVSLERLDGMTAQRRAALKDMWVTTVPDLLALADVPGGRSYLANTLQMSDTALDALLERAREMAPRADDEQKRLLDEAIQTDYGSGAIEPPAPLRGDKYDTIAFAGELPAQVNHVDSMPPTRNQGSRGTCVAHAAAAVREFLEIKAGVAQPAEINLSEQFIYWWCKERDNLPSVSGTYPHLGIQCLADAGTIPEADWPYNIAQHRGDEGQGPPPNDALANAEQYKLKRAINLDPKDVENLKTALADGKAILFAIPIFASWYQSQITRRYGKINMPLPGERPNGAHAMALVGYQDDDEAPGGGFFLLRNSWSPWGFDSPLGASYGSVPYAFIASHNMAAHTGDRASQADVYIRDSEADTGEVPSAGIRCNSPDIWLRHEADGESEHLMPAAGVENHIYVRAWNRGPGEANAVRAKVYCAPASPSIWPTDWQEIGEVAFDVIAAEASSTASLSWTPPSEDPYCFFVRLASPEDPVQHEWSVRDDNNLAQKNVIHLELPPGGQTEFSFWMHGLPGRTALLDLEVDRRGFPRGRVEMRLAERSGPAGSGGDAAEGEGEQYRGFLQLVEDEAKLTNFSLKATEQARIAVTASADSRAQATESGDIVITQRYGRLLVGRLIVHIEIV